MGKKELIDSLFVVLCLYEDVLKENSPTTQQDYFAYLKRKQIFFAGRGNDEIACTLKGLQEIGFNLTHKELRPIVFHMIGLIEKEGEDAEVLHKCTEQWHEPSTQ